MVKNIFLLALLTWVSFSYAKHPIVNESIEDGEAYKVEQAVEEQDAQRSVAGEKIKKKKKNLGVEARDDNSMNDSDSAVRYWEYSE